MAKQHGKVAKKTHQYNDNMATMACHDDVMYVTAMLNTLGRIIYAQDLSEEKSPPSALYI